MREMAHIAIWVVASGIVAELLGYLLHRLLHSGWIRWLSASHMKHHMLLYGPLQKQRPSERYMDATMDRLAIGNIGVEWLAPTAVLLGIAGVILWAVRVPFLHQLIFFATVVAWSFVMFSYPTIGCISRISGWSAIPYSKVGFSAADGCTTSITEC